MTMSNQDNTESISAKLRRWADIGEHILPLEAALWEFEIEGTVGWDDLRELFRSIADEIDREKREIMELYARQSWMFWSSDILTGNQTPNAYDGDNLGFGAVTF